MFVYISTKEQCCYFSYITENVKKNKKKVKKRIILSLSQTFEDSEVLLLNAEFLRKSVVLTFVQYTVSNNINGIYSL